MVDAAGRGAAQKRANFDRKQLDAIDWNAVPPGFAHNPAAYGVWKIWVTDHIADAACWVGAEHWVLVLSRATWRTLSFLPEAQVAFLQTFTKTTPGMKFLDLHAGPYGQAARAEAQQDGKVPLNDPLAALEGMAQRLLVEAAGLADRPSVAEVQIFTGRLADLQDRMVRLEERFTRARSLVDLAGDTVLGGA